MALSQEEIDQLSTRNGELNAENQKLRADYTQVLADAAFLADEKRDLMQRVAQYEADLEQVRREVRDNMALAEERQHQIEKLTRK